VDTDVYFRPEGPGRILAGDGTEHVEADPDRFIPSGDDAFVGHLAETFRRRLPGWADCALVRAWAGVCTSTPDRRPLVGPVDPALGLYALVGFNGFGVMRAGGVAGWLADRILEGPDSPAAARLAPVDPARFPPGTPSRPPRPGFTLEGGDAPRF
ncbi:MAG: FAD-binding oxidoreductase, partial [Thermoplasmata archaeon]